MKKLLELGRTADASLVVFGHSHRRFLEEEQGITLVNPGSIALPRDNKRGTYAVCEITNGTVGKSFLRKFEKNRLIFGKFAKKLKHKVFDKHLWNRYNTLC